jgi:hypothetical protein
MAEATFILRAVDATKQAFASAQNSLAKLQQSSQTASGFMKKAFDPRAIGAGLAASLGVSLIGVIDSAISKIADLFTRAGDVRRILREGRIESEAMLQAGLVAMMNPENQLKDTQDKIIKNMAEIEKMRENVRQHVVPLEGGTQAVVQTGTREEAQKIVELEADRMKLLLRLRILMREIEEDTSEIQKKSDDEALKHLKEVRDIMDSSSVKKIDGLEVSSEKTRERIDATFEQTQATLAQSKANRELGKSLSDSVMTPMEKYVAALERIDLLHAKKTIDDETMIRLTGEAGAAFAATSGDVEDMASRLSMVNEEANKTIPAMSQLAQMSNDAGNMIAQGFEDAILSGQKLSEVVRALGRDLVRLVFQQMVTQRLAAGVTGVLQGKGFAGFMADGGPVSAGSSYVVGEKGPELFVPHASGTIVPNNKMGGGSGSGGGSVTVNYNIAAGVSRAELAPILEQERRRLKAEIPDMVRRGGGYRAAFA